MTRFDDVALLADPPGRLPLLAPLMLAIPADPESLSIPKHRARAVAQPAPRCPRSTRVTSCLRAWEAGANAIEHAERARGRVVRVDVTLSGDRVRMGVADYGPLEGAAGAEDRGLGLR